MLSILILLVTHLQAEITPPTKAFKLDTLDIFYPRLPLSGVQEKHGQGEVYGENIRRFQLTHRRYKFSVFVQSKGGSIVAFWARLPSYFLHDTFHQALINRYGKQQSWRKKENTTVYSWILADKGIKLTYAGQCTINCFPLYLAAVDAKAPEDVETLTSKFNKF